MLKVYGKILTKMYIQLCIHQSDKFHPSPKFKEQIPHHKTFQIPTDLIGKDLKYWETVKLIAVDTRFLYF